MPGANPEVASTCVGETGPEAVLNVLAEISFNSLLVYVVTPPTTVMLAVLKKRLPDPSRAVELRTVPEGAA